MRYRDKTVKDKSTNDRFYDALKVCHYHLLNIFHKIVPSLTNRYVKRLFFRPNRLPLLVEERSFFNKGDEFTLLINGKTTRGWKFGCAPYILFVHGWNGGSSQFIPFIKELNKNNIGVIAFDAPAHGQSEGKETSYFEITDTIKALMDMSFGEKVVGIIAHSLGASGVINFLSKTGLNLPAVLIAPPLKLKELLQTAFKQFGIPVSIYAPILSALELQYGYSLEKDNPFLLMKRLLSDICIIHDEWDRTIPIKNSVRAAEYHSCIKLYKTKGLGHKKILGNSRVIQLSMDFIFQKRAAATPAPISAAL